ncbi:MAG: peptidase M23, partial [Saprospiraceae bacterium]|nr:peptidase M23 [Saprospiraceae bacterium]
MQANLSGLDKIELSSFPVVVPNMRYGFALDTFHVAEGTIQPNQFLGDLLSARGVNYQTIETLSANSKDVFDIRHLRVDRPYVILSKDPEAAADYFIYEPNVYEYIVFPLKGDLTAKRVSRPMDTELRTAAGRIESSLWQTMVDNGL